jgi:anti-sigma-K factor RskA
MPMSEQMLSDFCLERFVLGELSPEEAAETGQTFASDPRVRMAVDGLEASNREILQRYPAAAFKTGLLVRMRAAEEEAPGQRRRRLFPAARADSWRKILAFASAAAVLVFLAVLILPSVKRLSNASSSGPDVERTVVKGETTLDLSKTQLLVYEKRGDRTMTLADGNVVGAGALLQLAYVASGEPHGVIVSIDGAGGVSQHFPLDKGGSTLLFLNRRSLLPNAIELDDAPGFERFFLVTSKKPIDVETVLAKAAELARDPQRARNSELDLPAGLKQRSVLILKREVPR